MGKWFDQAAEVSKLRAEVKRQAIEIRYLREQLISLGVDPGTDSYGVSADERALVACGKPIQAIKRYRERTGADLLSAKNAIDSIS